MEDNKNKINKEIDKNEILIDDKMKQITGMGRVVEDLISPDIKSVDFGTFTLDNVKSVSDNLFGIRGKIKGTKYNLNEHIYSQIEDVAHADTSTLRGLLEGRAKLNSEMNFLVNNMLELQSALDMLADDVVFPTSSNISGIKIDFVGNNNTVESEKYQTLIKYFRPLDNLLDTIKNKKRYNYNIEEDVKRIVQYFGLYGHMIVCTIPYQSIARDILFDKKYNIGSVGEAVKLLQEGYSQKVKPFSESLNVDRIDPNLSKSIKEIVKSVPYSEADIDYFSHILESEEKSLFVDVPVETTNTVTNKSLQDLLTPVSEDGLNQLQIMNMDKIKKKNSKEFLIDKITGCTHDILDPNRVVPVKIKDEILGVYYVENETGYDTSLVGGQGLHGMKTPGSTFRQTVGHLQDDYSYKLKEILFNDISRVLYSNLDKKLLRNNANLIEDIQFIIDSQNQLGNPSSIKVRFIPAEYLTIHKVGPGPLGTPLLLKARTYAYLYIYLLKSDLISKMYLEKPRYIVDIKDDGNTSNYQKIKSSVDSIRMSIPRFSDIGIPEAMTWTNDKYHTILRTVDKNGEGMWSLKEVTPASERDNTEYLKMLKNQATMVLGYPADIFDPTQNIDFAKKIDTININTQIKVISLQNNLSLSLSEFCTKRLRYMIGDDDIQVKVTFEAPGGSVAEATKEIFEQRNQLVEIYDAIIKDSTNIKDEHKEAVLRQITRELMKGIVDYNLLDSVAEDIATFKDGMRSID